MKTNFEHSCTVQGYDAKAIIDALATLPEAIRGPITAVTKLVVMNPVANMESENGEKWEPDYDNLDQEKWCSVFDLNKDDNNPSGFRFVVSNYVNAVANADGAGLCFKDDETREQFVADHEDLYRQWLKMGK